MYLILCLLYIATIQNASKTESMQSTLLKKYKCKKKRHRHGHKSNFISSFKESSKKVLQATSISPPVERPLLSNLEKRIKSIERSSKFLWIIYQLP